MSVDEGVDVFVIHSWTKIWSCTGIRLGSVIGNRFFLFFIFFLLFIRSGPVLPSALAVSLLIAKVCLNRALIEPFVEP